MDSQLPLNYTNQTDCSIFCSNLGKRLKVLDVEYRLNSTHIESMQNRDIYWIFLMCTKRQLRGSFTHIYFDKGK